MFLVPCIHYLTPCNFQALPALFVSNLTGETSKPDIRSCHNRTEVLVGRTAASSREPLALPILLRCPVRVLGAILVTKFAVLVAQPLTLLLQSLEITVLLSKLVL